MGLTTTALFFQSAPSADAQAQAPPIQRTPAATDVTSKPVDGQPGILKETVRGGIALNIEMVRNGWAISDHSGMDAWEIIARENKRGLWQGQFVVPKKWRQGERLPGE